MKTQNPHFITFGDAQCKKVPCMVTLSGLLSGGKLKNTLNLSHYHHFQILHLNVNDTIEIRTDDTWFTGEIWEFTLCLDLTGPDAQDDLS